MGMKQINAAITLLYITFAVIFLTELLYVDARPEKIDCARYIYAPPCRGAAAKRSYMRLLPYSINRIPMRNVLDPYNLRSGHNF